MQNVMVTLERSSLTRNGLIEPLTEAVGSMNQVYTFVGGFAVLLALLATTGILKAGRRSMKHSRSLITGLVTLVGIVAAHPADAQQVPDTAFKPAITRPAYPVGTGPRLCLDEAHHNFHTLDNRFFVFGDLARRDGFRVAPLRTVFTAASLARCEVLVISNAQPSDKEWNTYPYPTPSAFTDSETRTVLKWVNDGGRLLLIADHMPLAGAASQLASAIGARFTDGFAYPRAAWRTDSTMNDAAASAPTMFRVADRTLAPHPILDGRGPDERVTQVRSFTGQAFQLRGSGSSPVMVLPADFISLEPRVAWQFEKTTTVRPVGNWLQGGTRRVGRGRVAIFGEAAMFSAQVAGPNRRAMGMNAQGAEQNAQFVLNVLHWLTGVIEP